MVENVRAVAGSAIDLQDYAIPADEPPSGELGKDAFLKLLVAQLKYQDPLEPSTSEEFIATTAQFTVVEKLDELTKQGANTALVNSLTTASALVGREVTATRNGLPVTAVVQQSKIVSGAVLLETDKGSIELSEIVSVGPAPATSPAPAPSPAPAASPAEAATVPEAPADATGQSAAPAGADAAAGPEIEPAPVVATSADSEVGSAPADAAASLTEGAGPAVSPAVQAEQIPMPTTEEADPAVSPAVQAEQIPAPTPEEAGDGEPSAVPVDGPPTVSVSSATPPSVEDADHAEAEPFDPFDAG